MSEVIPEGWSISTIEQLTANNSLFCDGDWVESKDQDPTGKNRLIQLADIGDGTFLNKSARFMNDEQFKRLKCTELRPNDILIARMPDPLGRACIYKLDSQRAATVVDVAILRTENANHYWLMSAINSPNFRFQIELNASGTTRTRIARGILSQIEVLTPPLPEQQKIATILSSVDNVIEKTRAKIDKLKDLKTGMMQELLTQGIGHTEFKDSPVGRIPASWNVKHIGDLLSLNYGKSPKEVLAENGSFPVWGTGGITGLSNEYLWDGESIVIGRKGTIDEPRYVTNKFWVIDTAYYTSNHKAIVKFLFYAFQLLNFKRLNEASGVPSLSRDTFCAEQLAIPPESEQKIICQTLDSIELNLQQRHVKLEKLCRVKKALMQDLLTGKVRVKPDPTEVAAA